ncbi:DUF255 domain-containing protein [Clostridium transplantifaecale]|nr:DUF255 domain-containing protein [Clostridium transplantifaecale]
MKRENITRKSNSHLSKEDIFAPTNISSFFKEKKGGGSVDNMNNTPNRLIHEKSPYLLQHAYNPVQWYPWGEEAFEKAKNENKPVFLSIGYS